MTCLRPALVALVCLCGGLAQPTLAQEADDRAFAQQLGKALERPAQEIEIVGARATPLAPASSSKTSDELTDDDYWNDSEEPAKAPPAKDPETPTGVSASYGALSVDRLRFPSAKKAKVFALEGSSLLTDSPLPVVLQQRGAYVFLVCGRELEKPERALEVLRAAWKHTPGKDPLENSYAWLPNVGEVKSLQVTSSLDALYFDRLAAALRPYANHAEVHQAGHLRALWVAHDPNLANAVRAYAKVFLKIPDGWRKP